MSRKIMVVTAAYGADQVRQAGGQRAMLPVIAGAGADGVEIRRELFSNDELMALPALGESIELLGLLACYSAPAPLFMPDGTLNTDLPRYLSEASALNALWLKVSLGNGAAGHADVRYGQLAVGWRLPGRGCTSTGSRRELYSCEVRSPA